MKTESNGQKVKMGGRGALSTLMLGLIFGGVFVYVAINSRLEGSVIAGDPASFSSRMLMTHGGVDQAAVNLRDAVTSAGIMSAIDGMAQKIGAAGGDLSESQVRAISQDFAKQIAEYLATKLSQTANASPCSVCWRHQNITGTRPFTP